VLLVKDIKYSLGHFLTGDPNLVLKGRFLEELKKREDVKTKLYSIIFYLAPGDYHRFHCPTDLDLKTRNHILGELEPVKVSHISRKAVQHYQN
jgi:phosphatidylserine decarboxylase